MQPYFYPYAGYFQLISAVDLFVIFDCVQFQRRGRVHRSQIPGPTEKVEWLTLPLARQNLQTLIREISFADGARRMLTSRLDRYPWISENGKVAHEIHDALYGELGSFMQFITENLHLVCRLLGLNTPFLVSSALSIPDNIRGSDRVIEIAHRLGATHYLNLPGGRSMYKPDDFDKAGLTLEFLADYEGPHRYMLHSLCTGDRAAIKHEVCSFRTEKA